MTDHGAPAADQPSPADRPSPADDGTPADDDDRTPADGHPPTPNETPPATPRPVIERIGLAFIALVLAIMFGGVSAASWVGGEPFLAVMGGVGCLMTVWVGVITLLRG